MNTSELESILRAAPRPAAPAGLQERLVREVRLDSGAGQASSQLEAGRWLRRWGPTLAFGGGILACAATLVTQQAELRGLQAQLQRLPESSAGPAAVEAVPSGAVAASQTSAEPAVSADRRLEIAQLRVELAALQSIAEQIQQLAAENRQLEAQPAAQPTLSTEDLEALERAQKGAQSIACINHLKNIGLAVRIWETENQGAFPPDFRSMSNDPSTPLATPKILVCPADSGRQIAADWTSFSAANVSYEYLAPGSDSKSEPNRVLTRCPIHGHVGLCDGSVQRVQDPSRQLVHRNGKLYFE